MIWLSFYALEMLEENKLFLEGQKSRWAIAGTLLNKLYLKSDLQQYYFFY